MIVQDALQKSGLNLRSLAEISEGEVSYAALRAWSAGIRTPEPESLRRLAEVFGKEIELLEGYRSKLLEAAEERGGRGGDGAPA